MWSASMGHGDCEANQEDNPAAVQQITSVYSDAVRVSTPSTADVRPEESDNHTTQSCFAERDGAL